MNTTTMKMLILTSSFVTLTATGQHQNTKVYGDPNDGRYLLTYTPAGVAPSNSDTAFTQDSNNCYYRSDTDTGSLVIPLQLPDDHRIQGIRYEYYDQIVNSSEYTEMKLTSFDHFGTVVNQVVIQSSGHVGLNDQFVLISPAIDVRNALYSYALELTDSGNFPPTTDLQHCSVSLSMTSIPASP